MIVLDYQDRRPLYEQVAEKLQKMIVKGILAQNEQLPSVRNLAMELSINPNTIQRAYSLLEQEGYIYPVKGRGNFVSPPENFMGERKESFFKELDELLAQGHDLGVSRQEVREHVDSVYKEGNR
ncbi:MAG: GntR family transcriptional regulator [Ruminococcus sp.]|jgi:GntR family transcriptional regulator